MIFSKKEKRWCPLLGQTFTKESVRQQLLFVTGRPIAICWRSTSDGGRPTGTARTFGTPRLEKLFFT
jgi:hypothetical protein